MALNDVYTVYGDSRSGNCYKAALILSLTGRRYAWREIDVMSGETRSPEFLRMNPNGKVPVLRLTDGRYLAESNAMLLHLAEGTVFLPEDSFQLAVVYQWLFFEQYSHEPCIAVARFIVRFAGREAQEAERLGQLRAKGREALAVMENSLAASDFIAGDDFSIADIALYAYTHVAQEGGFDMNDFPRIMGWLGRVESFPGFRCMQDACR
jgi:glutathione S-transferase